MRIPSGDLAPVRRRRRRRRGRALPVALAVLLVAAVAGGTALLRRDDDDAERLAAGRCGTPVAARAASAAGPALPAPGQVRFRLFNGTRRDGLARTVGDALAARGFAVLSTGNARAALPGPSRVAFGPGGRPAATLLAAQVSGARLVPVPRGPRGAVDLTLGTAFVRLRTPAEAAQAVRALTAPPPARPAAPVPQPSPSAPC